MILPILKQIYSRCLSLEEFIICLSNDLNKKIDMVRYGDNSEYLSLLSNIIVCYNQSKNRNICECCSCCISDDYDFNQPTSLYINTLQYCYNVTQKVDPSNLFISFYNMNTSIIREINFETLYDRIGSKLFCHLLLHTSLYMKLENDNVIQLTGKDFYILSQSTKIKCDNKDYLSRRFILYNNSYNRRAGFSSRHIISYFHLLSKDYTDKDKKNSILQSIFHYNKKKIPKRIKKLTYLLYKVGIRHNDCPYGYILNCNCPLVIVDNISLYNNTIEYDKVYSFVKTVINFLFVYQFWGSQHNYNIIMKTVYLLVISGKNDTFEMKYLMNGIKIYDFKYLTNPKLKGHSRPPEDYKKQYQLVHDFLKWFYDDIVLRLLKNHFYITEREGSFGKLFYYRKPMWKYIERNEIKKLIDSEYVIGVSKDYVNMFLNHKNSLGVSPLRFVPKSTKIRPIINLSSHKYNKISINQQLKNIFIIIKYEYEKHDDIFDTSLLGMSEIYKPYYEFVKKFKNNSKDLYYVVLDMTCCYDNIDAKVLMEYLCAIINKPEYYIYKFNIIQYSNTNKKIKNIKYPVISSKKQILSHLMKKINKKYHHSIILYNGNEMMYNRNSIMNMLNKHLNYNLIIYGNKYYIQKKGIPQGSILSSLLCNIYYATIEKEYIIPKLPTQNNNDLYLILRLVDDYLCISSSIEFTENFYNSAKCLEEYGCIINDSKTKTNLVEGSINKYLAWCGLIVNIDDLSINNNHERYFSVPISNTISKDYTNYTLEKLIHRYFLYFKPKCNVLLIDEEINDTRIILRNICELFIIGNCKFLCLIDKKQKIKSKHIHELIQKIVLKCYKYIVSIYKSHSHIHHHPNCGIEYIHVHLLFAMSFLKCIKKYKPHFKEIKSYLDKVINANSYTNIFYCLNIINDFNLSSLDDIRL